MRTFRSDDISPRELHKILLSGVAPRPIALVSSMSTEGVVNLSPFSFFNAFSSNPPVVVFSPSYRGTDGSAKDTFRNVVDTRECTISAVSYAMVGQVNLASAQYPPEVDEFEKAGLTKHPSVDVAAPGVAESPFILECRLLQYIELAKNRPASGNLMICEVIRFHVKDSAFTGDVIDPRRMDLVARMGLNWYTRANGEMLFELPQPRWNGIGLDALPEEIRTSTILTGNDLAKLAGVREMPVRNDTFSHFAEPLLADDIELELHAGNPMGALYVAVSSSCLPDRILQHEIARAFLVHDDVEHAWQTLLL